MFGSLSLSRVFATDGDGWKEIDIKESYDYNDTFTVPEMTFVKDGKSYRATFTLQFPDGKVGTNSSVKLDMAGVYTLSYSVKTDKEEVFGKEFSFDVQNDTVVYTKDGTTCTYGNLKETGAGDTSTYNAKTEGLYVRLAEGDTLTFSQYIDVKDLTATDMLTQLFVIPDERGECDFDRIILTLTDSEDPENTLRIVGHRYGNYGATYFLTAGENQTLTGWERTSSNRKKHVLNDYGTPTNMAFGGKRITNWQTKTYGDVMVDENAFSFSLDAKSLELYVFTKKAGNTNIVPNELMEGTLCADLDSDDFSSVWGGFKSGKARLSISAEGYNSSTANFCVSYIRGIDLSQKVYLETKAPNITVEQPTETPLGEVNASYKIPKATAKDDFFGDCPVNVAVWYNYLQENERVQVSVIDGKFTPKKTGDYAVVYTASDRLGNTAQEVVYVKVFDKLDEIGFALPENLPQSGYVGMKLQLPEIENITGGSGEKTVSVLAECGDEKITVKDNVFTPTKEGDWLISYVATDYLGKETKKSFSLRANVYSGYILENEPTFPFAFVAENSYVLPEVRARRYSADGSFVSYVCKAVIDGKTYEAGETYKPEATKNAELKNVVFKCGVQTVYETKIPCVIFKGSRKLNEKLSVTEYYPERYFVGNTQAECLESGIQITSTTNNASWSFANTVNAVDFSMSFGEFNNMQNGNRLTVRLYEHENKTNEAVLTIEKDEDGYFAYSGNGKQYRLSSLTLTEQTVRFDGKNFFVGTTTVPSGVSITSGKADLKVEHSGKLSYIVNKLNGQSFNTSLRLQGDTEQPSVSVLGSYGGVYKINSVYTVNPAISLDVLSPNTDFTLTVEMPSGEPMQDENGKVLSGVDPSETYVIKLRKYGKYRFIYTAKENDEFFAGKEARTFIYIVSVVDDVAPEIHFEKEITDTAKVGDTVKIPAFTVSDNLTSSEKIKVVKFVRMPKGALITIPEGTNSFVCTTSGEYEVCITVYDETGNVCYYKKTVKVS